MKGRESGVSDGKREREGRGGEGRGSSQDNNIDTICVYHNDGCGRDKPWSLCF